MNKLALSARHPSPPSGCGLAGGVGCTAPSPTTGHCVIVLESLITRHLPAVLERFIERVYQHWLGGSRLTTIAILTIPAEDVRGAAEEIAIILRPAGFYAHIVWQGKLLIIFPNSVVDLDPNDSAEVEKVRLIGTTYSIPVRQMPFEHLVAIDHPNDPRGQAAPSINPTDFFSQRNSEEMSAVTTLCGRVVALTEDGLTADVVANGAITKVRFPAMPGPNIGDLIGSKGEYREERGERVLDASHWTTLTPTLRTDLFTNDGDHAPREITLLQDEALRNALAVRRQVIKTVREYLDARRFLEMETPIILPIRDIAPVPHFAVTPARDGTAVLRICPENALKRLIVAGFDRVYEIARNFRVENAAHHRSSEFTTVECYAAYTTYLQTMDLCEDLIRNIIRTTLGGNDVLRYQNREIDIKTRWERLDFQTAVQRATGIELERAPDTPTLKSEMAARGINAEGLHSRRACINHLAEIVEEQLNSPTFLMDHPSETICVAQRHDAPRSHLLQRFELFIGGMEIAHAFAELTDPLEQRARMQELLEEKIAAGDTPHPLDLDFLKAIDIGLPPTCGLGIGIDRLVMLLTNEPIDRVIAFPLTL